MCSSKECQGSFASCGKQGYIYAFAIFYTRVFCFCFIPHIAILTEQLSIERILSVQCSARPKKKKKAALDQVLVHKELPTYLKR